MVRIALIRNCLGSNWHSMKQSNPRSNHLENSQWVASHDDRNYEAEYAKEVMLHAVTSVCRTKGSKLKATIEQFAEQSYQKKPTG